MESLRLKSLLPTVLTTAARIYPRPLQERTKWTEIRDLGRDQVANLLPSSEPALLGEELRYRKEIETF